MLTLTGTLRQAGELKINDRPFRKLWIEHETPPDGDRPGDLNIFEFLLPSEEVARYPPQGEPISLDVRAYVRGRDVAYKALGVIPGPPSLPGRSKASEAK